MCESVLDAHWYPGLSFVRLQQDYGVRIRVGVRVRVRRVAYGELSKVRVRVLYSRFITRHVLRSLHP